jgi:hypothetical protein
MTDEMIHHHHENGQAAHEIEPEVARRDFLVA